MIIVITVVFYDKVGVKIVNTILIVFIMLMATSIL